MATCAAVSPIIDQEENLAVMGLAVFVVPEEGPPPETLSSPSFTLVPAIPQLSVVPSLQPDGSVRFSLSAPDLFGLIPDGTIKYRAGKAAPVTVLDFDALPGPPADIFDYEPSGTQEATAVLTLIVQSSAFGTVSFPFDVHVTGSFTTARDRLVAAVAALGS